MGKMEVPIVPNLIPRLLSDGALRRADSYYESGPERKWTDWVSLFNFTRMFETLVRKH